MTQRSRHAVWLMQSRAGDRRALVSRGVLKGGGGRKSLRDANMNERSRERSCFLVMGPSLLQRLAVGGWRSLGGGGLSLKKKSDF